MRDRGCDSMPRAIVRLRFELFVAELDRSVDFYERALGFRVERRERRAGVTLDTYVELINGDAAIGLGLRAALPTGHHLATPPHARVGGGVELVFEVADVDAWERRAHKAGVIYEPLRPRPWGARDFRVVDPDGYYIRVTEPRARKG